MGDFADVHLSCTAHGQACVEFVLLLNMKHLVIRK